VTTVALIAPNRPIKASALLIATRSGDEAAVPIAGAEIADEMLGGGLAGALAAARARGGADEVIKIPTLAHGPVELIVAVGLGTQGDDALGTEAVRRAVGNGIRALAGVDSVLISIGATDDVAIVAAAAEGAALAGYAFTRFKSTAVTAPTRRVQIRADASTASRAAIRRASIIGTGAATIRDLVNAPPADLFPASFAARISKIAEAAGLTSEILDEKALRKGNYGGILGVGQGSSHPPRLVRLTYRPARPKARIALVGKGITFDTGGYNIKVPLSGSMKHDMAGAATMLAVAIAAAELKLPVEVIATGAMAENMVSSTSYLTSDILTIRNGTTVEVDNTDAEGRLVLADGIVRAAEDKPDYLLEASTLTGGALVALGLKTAGVMGSDALRDEVVAAGAEVGESLWPMPLLPELRAGLESPVADLRNVSGDRYGQMLVAGLFLAEFVPDGLPWAHIDMAGPGWNPAGAYGYTPTGGTGYALRTVLRVIERIAARS
jgi:leucyl aminopeptidase